MLLTRRHRRGWQSINSATQPLPRLFRNVESLHKEEWMRAQTGIRTIPGTPRIRQAKLLLVGSEDEFQGSITSEMMDGVPSYMAGRSATLLGALARLHSEAIDV